MAKLVGLYTETAEFDGRPRIVNTCFVDSRRAGRGTRQAVHATLSLMNPNHLLAEALQLSAEERAALAGQLIESLDQQVDADAETAWSVEIQRRLQRFDDGIARTVPWAEARRRILAAADRDAGT